MAPLTIDLDQLSRQIDADGVVAHQPDVMHLAVAAHTSGVAPIATSILVDPGEPDAVRERAFAHVAIALRRTTASRPLIAA